MSNLIEFPIPADIRDEAAAWLVRLDGDKALSAQDRDALRKWVSKSEKHLVALQEAASLWGDLNVLTELAVPLDKPALQRSSAKRQSPVRLGLRLAMAATLATMAVLVFLQVRPDPLLETNGFVATAVGEQQATTLADGTVIHLNTDTQLKIEYSSELRKVFLLRGEAHFEVAKMHDVPFLVDAGVGWIEAVGTAFSVYRRADAIDVTVTEGRVALSAEPVRSAANDGATALVPTAEPPVILDAGQVATIETPDLASGRESGAVAIETDVSDRDISRRLLWKNGMLAFSRAPLGEVVAEIGRYTTQRFEFEDDAIAEKTFIGRIPIGDTDAFLDALKSDSKLAVTRTGPNSVLISAREDP